jgi:PAS domain S-box-containing protein
MNKPAETLDLSLSAFAPTGKAAEETLHAIVLGDADAILIETADGPRVYTLRDASEPYRELVERMPGAATVLDAEHTILYSNGGLARMLGRGEVAGANFLDLVTPTQRGLAREMLAAGLEAQTAIEIALVAADGAKTPVRASAAPISFDSRSCVALVVTALDDIEALRISAAELRESQRRFQTALENSRVSVFEQDLDLRYTWMYNSRLGYRPEAFIGKTDADLMDPVCAAELTAIKRRVIETGQPSRQEVAAAAPGAPFEYYELHVEPRYDGSGKIIGVGCAATDITARKQSEEQALSRSVLLRTVIEATSDLVWAKDTEGRLLLGNQATFDLLGEGDPEKVLGLSMRELVPVPEFAESMLESDARVMASGRRETVEQLFGAPDRPLVLQVVKSPLRDGAGNVVGLVGVSRDITNAKKASEALQRSEQRFRLATQLSKTIAFTYDRDLRCTWSHGTQTGYDDAEILGKTLHELFAPESADRLVGLYRQALDGAVIREDVTLLSLAGLTPQVFDVFAEPLRDASDEIVGIIGAARNITARVEAANALATAKAEAERASEAKSKFLAAASHDLRQPAQSLILLLSLLERKAAGDPKLIEIVRAMESAVSGLNVLLSGILDISRLDAGVMAPEMQPVDVGLLIEQISEEYRERASKKALTLRSAPRNLWANSDPALLQRAMRNLIENALNYTREGGILIGARVRGERVRIDVVDTGIGIPAEQCNKIFEEFYQVQNPGRTPGEGLGLGLAIVSRIAVLLGAEVEVASRVGRGSRFSLLLPLDRDRLETATPESAPASAGLGGRVLLIEDNSILRFIGAALLEEWGCGSLSAASGEEALELAAAERWRFDAIIADYRLGGALTGIAAAKEIERQAGRTIPTIVLTGDTAIERISEMDNSGYVVLHKPVDAENLRRELERGLGGGSPPRGLRRGCGSALPTPASRSPRSRG